MRNVEDQLENAKACAAIIKSLYHGMPAAGLANSIIKYVDDALDAYEEEREAARPTIPGVI